jgi:hypothetical protein
MVRQRENRNSGCWINDVEGAAESSRVWLNRR